MAADWLRLFSGETVYLVAGGASLRGFPFGYLDDRKVCAINRAYEVLANAQMIYWSDAIFWRARKPEDGASHGEAIMEHSASLKATLDLGYQPGELPDAIVRFRQSDIGIAGFDCDHRRLCHGNNSAFAAMHILAHMRPARIVLLGVDMKHGDGGRTHWHSGHNRYISEETLTDMMLPHFAALVKPMADRDIEVLNASPDSALKLWPKISHQEALKL